MNTHKKARELGWEIQRLSSRPPYEYAIRRRGWMSENGPDSDTHYARGGKGLEELLAALENGDPTEQWKQRHP